MKKTRIICIFISYEEDHYDGFAKIDGTASAGSNFRASVMKAIVSMYITFPLISMIWLPEPRRNNPRERTSCNNKPMISLRTLVSPLLAKAPRDASKCQMMEVDEKAN